LEKEVLLNSNKKL